MKRINFILIGLGFILMEKISLAQQEPMFTHYMFNKMSMNPAYAGTRNALSIVGLSRLQWIGLDGAPRSYAISLHTPISSKKIGIGFSLITDELGPMKNSYFTLNYAYRINLNERWILSLGLKAGFNNFNLGLTDVSLNDANDPDFLDNAKKLFAPNVGVGAYLYDEKFYVGFSAPKIVNTKLDGGISSADAISLKRHYFIMSGYVFDINPDTKIKPSFSAKMVEGAPISLDLSVLFLYHDRIWAGPMYRFGDALGFLLDLKVNRQLTIGYSYDLTLSSLSTYNKGSHEILVSYDLDGFLNKKIESPRYF